jgi:hypothetical protein
LPQRRLHVVDGRAHRRGTVRLPRRLKPAIRGVDGAIGTGLRLRTLGH